MLRIILLSAIVLFSGCLNRARDDKKHSKSTITDNVFTNKTELNNIVKITETGRKLDSLGLVNISNVDPEIIVRIVYATPENFTEQILYHDLNEAYLLPEAAERLSKAQKLLSKLRPKYKLIVYDAARPMSVQREMRKVAEKMGKHYYVADPSKGGGLHNYGAAVDVSILDSYGVPLPMGTKYDFFGPEANIDNENALLAQGKITEEELNNRLLLRKVMREAGFRTVKSEWWHFNLCSREEAKKRYPLIDF